MKIIKKIKVLFICSLVFSSCLKSNDNLNYEYKLLPIKEYTVPTSFTHGQKDTIKIKYLLKENCAFFENVYYEYQDTVRIVAINSFIDLDKTCTDETTEKDYNLIVTATQTEDYVFKFWKGKDNDGNDIFEEAIVPVN